MSLIYQTINIYIEQKIKTIKNLKLIKNLRINKKTKLERLRKEKKYNHYILNLKLGRDAMLKTGLNHCYKNFCIMRKSEFITYSEKSLFYRIKKDIDMFLTPEKDDDFYCGICCYDQKTKCEEIDKYRMWGCFQCKNFICDECYTEISKRIDVRCPYCRVELPRKL